MILESLHCIFKQPKIFKLQTEDQYVVVVIIRQRVLITVFPYNIYWSAIRVYVCWTQFLLIRLCRF